MESPSKPGHLSVGTCIAQWLFWHCASGHDVYDRPRTRLRDRLVSSQDVHCIGGKLRYHVTVLVLHSWVTAKERRNLVHCYKRMVSARVLCVQCTMVFGYAVYFCVWCRHARDYERRQSAMFSSFYVFTCDKQLRHTLTLVSCQVLVWHLFGPYACFFLAHKATSCVCIHFISVSIPHQFQFFP